MAHGPQQGKFDLRFELPAACAASVKAGSVEIGLVPVIEVFRQHLEVVSDVGIASDGAVRSIFLLHKKPLREIRSVALDSSSRTSVALTRIVLADRYGVRAEEHTVSPAHLTNLEEVDAAVVIGDPALRLSPPDCNFSILDLGSEWTSWTGLPMVYAVWAGLAGKTPETVARNFRESYEFGKSNLDNIIHQEAPARQISTELAREYLERHIRYELDGRTLTGMREFERLARQHRLI